MRVTLARDYLLKCARVDMQCHQVVVRDTRSRAWIYIHIYIPRSRCIVGIAHTPWATARVLALYAREKSIIKMEIRVYSCVCVWATN